MVAPVPKSSTLKISTSGKRREFRRARNCWTMAVSATKKVIVMPKSSNSGCVLTRGRMLGWETQWERQGRGKVICHIIGAIQETKKGNPSLYDPTLSAALLARRGAAPVRQRGDSGAAVLLPSI